MSYFISPIEGAGLSEMPPVSNVIPLPTRTAVPRDCAGACSADEEHRRPRAAGVDAEQASHLLSLDLLPVEGAEPRNRAGRPERLASRASSRGPRSLPGVFPTSRAQRTAEAIASASRTPRRPETRRESRRRHDDGLRGARRGLAAGETCSGRRRSPPGRSAAEGRGTPSRKPRRRSTARSGRPGRGASCRARPGAAPSAARATVAGALPSPQSNPPAAPTRSPSPWPEIRRPRSRPSTNARTRLAGDPAAGSRPSYRKAMRTPGPLPGEDSVKRMRMGSPYDSRAAFVLPSSGP